MLALLLIIGLVFCAVGALRAARLLHAAIWLAGVSVFLALFLSALGAASIAVIELSVGVGLVTVLLVYAISIVEDDGASAQALVPKPLAWALVIAPSLALAWMVVPWAEARGVGTELPFGKVLWQLRGLDVLGQAALIFAGAIGVLGLLADIAAAPEPILPLAEAAFAPAAEQVEEVEEVGV